MKIKITLLSIAAAGFAHAASTATVSNVDFTVTNAVVSSGGNVYADGSGYVAIGVFSIGDAAIQASVSVGDLDAAFTQFGSSNTFGASFNIPGTYEFESSGANITAGDTYEGNSIYTVLGNGATLATSTEVLVYKHVETFQANPTSSGPAKLSAADPGTLVLGQFGTYSHDIGLASGSAPAFNTVALIPEPSVALLGLAGGLLMLRRRRC